MMDLAELKKGLARAKDELLANLQQSAAIIGADAAALTEDRIVKRGERADGAKFSPYSTKPVPAYFYFGRSRNAAGEKSVRAAAAARQGVPYAEFRRFNGLNTAIKNFQFTGEMWQGFGVISVKSVAAGIAEIEIGGKNARSELLLKAHSTREGIDLTKNSNTELLQIETAISKRVSSIIAKNIK